MHKVSCWLVGLFFINHHLFSLIASLHSHIFSMRKNLELMHILTLPFLSHAKPPTSKKYYWEHALQPSEWKVRGTEGYKMRPQDAAWQVSFVGILF